MNFTLFSSGKDDVLQRRLVEMGFNLETIRGDSSRGIQYWLSSWSQLRLVIDASRNQYDLAFSNLGAPFISQDFDTGHRVWYDESFFLYVNPPAPVEILLKQLRNGEITVLIDPVNNLLEIIEVCIPTVRKLLHKF